MKRFWLMALLMAGSLAVLTAPGFAKTMDSSDSSADVDTSLDDINSAMGSMAVQMNDIKSKLGLTIFGDVRARYAVWSQSQSNATAPAPGIIADKAVGRYRARIGAKESFGDFSGGLRIATGGATNPNSQNNTYDAGFADPTVNIDLAYLTVEPTFLNKMVKLTVGKMGNPLVTTPMTWDPDINPEGAEVEFTKGDTKFRADYFDIANQAGKNPTTTNSGVGTDEYMANFQLEQTLKISDATAKLMVGYEYIPYANALAGGTPPGVYVGPGGALATSNTPFGAGNIVNANGFLPDFMVGEAMIQVKHNIGDTPMQYTLHVIDNFNADNVPVNAPTAGTHTASLAGYTKLTTNLGWYLEAKAGDTNPGDFLACLAASYVEPNAQLANLASDDANFTNTQYLFEQVGYGVEKNVSLLLSAWEIQRIYYAYYGAATNTMITAVGGNTRNPLIQVYADCVLSL